MKEIKSFIKHVIGINSFQPLCNTQTTSHRHRHTQHTLWTQAEYTHEMSTTSLGYIWDLQIYRVT